MEEKPEICSVDEAIEKALALISLADREILAKTEEDELNSFHMSLGGAIRAALDLWNPKSEKLLSEIAKSDPTYPFVIDWGDCYAVDPDGASAILLRAVRRRILDDKNSR
jgi:urease accessory protein UreF